MIILRVFFSRDIVLLHVLLTKSLFRLYYLVKLRGVHATENASVTQKRFSLVRSPSQQDDVLTEDQFAHEVYGATLETLDLSNNRLCEVPSTVCELRSLEELDLSG